MRNVSTSAVFNLVISALLLIPGFGGWGLLGAPAAQDPAKKGRVVAVQEDGALATFVTDYGVVDRLVRRGLTNLTHTTDVRAAWRSLVSTNDKVGIKVFSTPGPISGTRPAVVESVIRGLIASGVKPTNILIWDKKTAELHLAGYFELAAKLGVRAVGTAEGDYDEKSFYENSLLGKLIWGDHEFGGKQVAGVGRKSFVSKRVTKEMTRIISIAPMLSHNVAGVSGHLYGLSMGSVDNTLRFESEADTMATAIPEIMALPVLGDRVVLSITDALICQYEGEQRGLLHYSSVMNELMFSADPVALDVLSLREIFRQRTGGTAEIPKKMMEIYSNAALLEIGQSDLKSIVVERPR